MYGLKDEYLKTIIDVLKKEDVKKAILFGSRAKGNYKEGSDIDLAIVGDEKKLNYILNEETNIPYFFDILNLEKISNENLKEHIKRVGKNLI